MREQGYPPAALSLLYLHLISASCLVQESLELTCTLQQPNSLHIPMLLSLQKQADGQMDRPMNSRRREGGREGGRRGRCVCVSGEAE